MYTASNGQVSVTLSGWAGDSRRLYYLSVVGTQAELRSLKAGLVTGKKVHTPFLGSLSHKSGEPWREFSASIPNSAFTHYVWLSADPAFIFVTDHEASQTVALASNGDRRQADYAYRDKALLENAPAALFRSLDETKLPIPQHWSQTLFDEAKRHYRTHTIDRYGNITYAALRDTDESAWKNFVTLLVHQGKLE